jgi:hypothetical protein
MGPVLMLKSLHLVFNSDILRAFRFSNSFERSKGEFFLPDRLAATFPGKFHPLADGFSFVIELLVDGLVAAAPLEGLSDFIFFIVLGGGVDRFGIF